MSIASLEICDIELVSVTITEDSSGTVLLRPTFTGDDIRNITKAVIQHMKSTDNGCSSGLYCLVLPAPSLADNIMIEVPCIVEDELSFKISHVREHTSYDKSIDTRGIFNILVDIPTQSEKMKHAPYFVITGIAKSDTGLPKFVGDGVFPDWLPYRSHGITCSQLIEFMATY